MNRFQEKQLTSKNASSRIMSKDSVEKHGTSKIAYFDFRKHNFGRHGEDNATATSW